MVRILPPSFAEEHIVWKSGITHIAGVDEVGRGAFAGPVVAAAVILPQQFPTDIGVHDSKLLSPRKREELSLRIQQSALSFAIASVPVRDIDLIGIGKATFIAMRRAISLLSIRPEFVLVDGFLIPSFAKVKQKPLIKGDRKSISIAAASIIAKVYRDSLMSSLPEKYQKYRFELHKGYGTKYHQECLQKYGLCDLHRKSFDLAKFLIHHP